MRCLSLLVILLAASGCDAGGLLEVTPNEVPDAGSRLVLGPSTHDFVSAGTVAGNDKYKIVFTFGQATPNQGSATSPGNQLNGGLVGATQGK